MRHFLDPVENVVKVRRDRVEIFRIERRDEGLVQAREDLMNNLVAPVLEGRDLSCVRGENSNSAARPFEKKMRGFGNDNYLAQKKCIKLLFTRKESHSSSAICTKAVSFQLKPRHHL